MHTHHHSIALSLDSAGPTMVWVIVLSFVFVECAFIIGLFLPGDSLLFTAGVVLAGHHHVMHAWALSIAAVVVAVVGNQLGFVIGRRGGRALVDRLGGRMVTVEHLERAKTFLDRHGWWSIVLARWIPWIRTLAPLIAGAAGMRTRRFLLATSAGAIAWVPALVLAGYYGADLLERFPWVRPTLTISSVVFFVIGTSWGIWKYRQQMRKPQAPVAASESTS